MKSVVMEVPREALDVDIHPPSMSISWKPRDWKWLYIFKMYVKDNPEDYLSKRVYNNYLRWYRNN